MNTFLTDIWQEIHQYYDGLVAFAPKLIMALILIVAVWFISRSIRTLFRNRLKNLMEDPLLANFLSNMVRSVIVIVGWVFAFKILGLGGITASILAGAGITAFIIGFALRDIGENFLAGIIMAFKRPFRVGDFVETTGIRGHVQALNIRDTQLKTPDGKDVYIPNANILKNPLINFTIDGFLRYDFLVGLPTTSDYNKTMEAIFNSVIQVKGVLKNRKKTTVHITGIAPGKVDVMVSFWIDTFVTKDSAEKIRSEVIDAVQKVLEPL